MKTRVILTSFALAAVTGSMFVSCTNEELIKENGSSIENQYGMIELDENFMIGAVGVSDPASRTHWELTKEGSLTNVYLPMIPGTGETANTTIANVNVVSPSIGLCWIGNGGAGEQVYTNYEFFHYGWLGKGQESASFDECDNSKLLNGWTYDEFNTTSSNAGAGEEINYSEFTANPKTVGNTTINAAEANLNSGVYKTCNKAIFGGKYIAYYPFNKDFKDAGAIPAKSVVTWSGLTPGNVNDLKLSYNTFRYTSVSEINGGTQANGFGFKNLSGVVRIVLKGNTDYNVKRIILYSEDNSFIEEALLSPAKIAEGKTGQDLYSSIVKRSNTITLVMKGSNKPLSVLSNEDALDEGKRLANCVYITTLPTTVKNLKVLVQADNFGQWAECDYGTLTVSEGKGTELIATIGEYKPVYYASTSNTLSEAIKKVNNLKDQQGIEAAKKAVIQVLGDLTIAKNMALPEYATVEGGKIIVPEDVTLTVNDNSIVKSDIVVKGQTCCSNSEQAGKLIVNAAKVLGNITTEAAETNNKSNAEVEFDGTTIDAASTVTLNGTVTVKGTTNIFGNVVLNEKATATVSADAEANFNGGILTNNGEIKVEEKAKFNILDAKGQTVASAGKNFTNNGTFIDAVGAIVGGATQYMVNNGDYICEVNDQNRMSEAYENKLACNIIDIVKAGTDNTDTGFNTFSFNNVQQHNGEDVDIRVSADYVRFRPLSPITIGNLTVNPDAENDFRIAKSETVTDAKGAIIGYATITVNGNFDVYGKVSTGVDLRNFKADNLSVYDKGSIEFTNRIESQDVTMSIAKTIEVKKGATFTIDEATAGQNTARVTCTRLVEGGTFHGKPIVVE